MKRLTVWLYRSITTPKHATKVAHYTCLAAAVRNRSERKEKWRGQLDSRWSRDVRDNHQRWHVTCSKMSKKYQYDVTTLTHSQMHCQWLGICVHHHHTQASQFAGIHQTVHQSSHKCFRTPVFYHILSQRHQSCGSESNDSQRCIYCIIILIHFICRDATMGPI